MPSKKSSKKRSARIAHVLELDKTLANAPARIQKRLSQLSALADSLGKIGCYGWNGYSFDENGQAIALKKIGRANRDRHNDSLAKIKALAQKYRRIWQKHSAAGIIARLEGISPDTVRRYKRLYPAIA
jgi:hypothetical protein